MNRRPHLPPFCFYLAFALFPLALLRTTIVPDDSRMRRRTLARMRQLHCMHQFHLSRARAIASGSIKISHRTYTIPVGETESRPEVASFDWTAGECVYSVRLAKSDSEEALRRVKDFVFLIERVSPSCKGFSDCQVFFLKILTIWRYDLGLIPAGCKNFCNERK